MKKTFSVRNLLLSIFIGAIFSLIINGAYYAVESFCAKNDKAFPIHKIEYGSDCEVNSGIYWYGIVGNPETDGEEIVEYCYEYYFDDRKFKKYVFNMALISSAVCFVVMVLKGIKNKQTE
ncbi:MAG: hypothetical protein J5802_02420 [Butyrivibrio sp.]|nr:hypothetical protein [Butyrivibrio sp.]